MLFTELKTQNDTVFFVSFREHLKKNFQDRSCITPRSLRRLYRILIPGLLTKHRVKSVFKFNRPGISADPWFLLNPLINGVEGTWDQSSGSSTEVDGTGLIPGLIKRLMSSCDKLTTRKVVRSSKERGGNGQVWWDLGSVVEDFGSLLNVATA